MSAIRVGAFLTSLCALAACASAPGIGPSSDGASVFANQTAAPYYTSDPYGRRASTSFPRDPVAYYERVQSARAMARAGDCAGATPLLEQAADEYADDGAVLFLLAVCRAEAGDWRAAAAAGEAVLPLGVAPSDPDVRANPNDIMVEIGAFYARAGDDERAIDWVRRGLEARYDERPGIAQAPEAAELLDHPEFAALAGLPPNEPLTRDEMWRYDIGFLRDQVALLHYDPDQRTPADELERMLDEISDAVPELTDSQIAARLELFVGALGAGHDRLFPIGDAQGAIALFAVKAYFFTDGLYVIEAADPTLVGARIDAFGDTPTAEAYARVAETMARDNDMEARWVAPARMMQPETLEALGLVADAATATLTVTGRDGAQRTVAPERRAFSREIAALSTPPGAVPPLYLTQLETAHWTTRIDDLHALYVQVNTLNDSREESLTAFAARMAEEARDPSVHNLIFDLRHSGGGNSYLSVPLARALIAFSADPDKDGLYVLMGRNTFSASQNLLTDLDRLADVVLVGEPSGSRPNTIAEAGRYVLPFSRLSGFLSSQFHQQSWPEDHRIWIAPDVPVGLSSEDFFAGRDPAMEAIADLIAQGEG